MKILIRGGEKEKWQVVESAAYGAEENLQRLLAEEPSLVSLSEEDEGSAVLVGAIREFPLDIGSIDILAFTARGDVAVIECKLASNAEIKRKVISQVFEYGANLWHMSYEDLDQRVLMKTGKNLVDFVRGAVDDPDWSEESFRANIAASLQDGNFRMMIVVDEMSEDLGRIVSFVNSAGNPAFSLAALEMRRFRHRDSEMLVPHIYGLVDKQRDQASASIRKKWDEASYLQDVKMRLKPPVAAIVADLLEWSKINADSIGFGSGGASGSFMFYLERDGNRGSVFSVYSNGLLSIHFAFMKRIRKEEGIGAFSSRIALIPSLKEVDSSKYFYYNTTIEKAFLKSSYLDEFKKAVLNLKSA